MEKPMGNHWGTTDFGILVQAKAVAQWVRRVVVRHGLCPWAEEALVGLPLVLPRVVGSGLRSC